MHSPLTTEGRRPSGVGRRAPPQGFTLIELMVVVSIIGLLVAILVPVVTAAWRAAEVTKTKAWVVTLANGCLAFKVQTHYFPGQEDYDKLRGTGGSYTGSQILGARLFGYADLDDIGNTNKPPPTEGTYAPVKIGDLDKFSISGQWKAKHTKLANPPNGFPCSVLDRASEPMAILYYPYRINENPANPADAYKYNDNNKYIETTALYNDYVAVQDKPASYTFNTYCTDMQKYFAGTTMAENNVGGATNEGGFLMAAAGKDRLYFTSDDIIYP